MPELNEIHGVGAVYFRRPVQVTAIQWQGSNTAQVAEFLHCQPQTFPHADGTVQLQAPGLTRLSEGDWIVRDQAGFLVAWTDYYFNYLYQGPL
jgi:hypothetical protein